MSNLRDESPVFSPVAIICGLRVVLFFSVVCGQLACGSSSKSADGTTSTGGTSSGGTTGGEVGGGTTGAACTTPNCDKTGNEPTFSPMSTGVSATPAAGGTAAAVQYIRFQDSNTDKGTAKQFELAGLDYDPCVFAWNHAQTSNSTFNYSLFPAAPFNFFGVYLVNGTPGTPLTAGTYSASATSGQYVVVTGSDGTASTNPSGAGYNITSCAGQDYEAVTGGNIVISAVSATGVPTGGTFNLTTTNDTTAAAGGSISGAFTVGSCGTASGVEPVATQPDANACTLH